MCVCVCVLCTSCVVFVAVVVYCSVHGVCNMYSVDIVYNESVSVFVFVLNMGLCYCVLVGGKLLANSVV